MPPSAIFAKFTEKIYALHQNFFLNNQQGNREFVYKVFWATNCIWFSPVNILISGCPPPNGRAKMRNVASSLLMNYFETFCSVFLNALSFCTKKFSNTSAQR